MSIASMEIVTFHKLQTDMRICSNVDLMHLFSCVDNMKQSMLTHGKSSKSFEASLEPE